MRIEALRRLRHRLRQWSAAAGAAIVTALSWEQAATAAHTGLPLGLPLVRPAAGTEESAAASSARFGTGIVISDQGHILTSLHVVRGCRVVRFAHAGERPGFAFVVGRDVLNDLALLKAPRAPMTAATFRVYPPAREGEFVRFAAMPEGVESWSAAFRMAHAVAVSRTGAQRDARLFAISGRLLGEARGVGPGDSGGPVFDDRGAVVGLVVGTVPEDNGVKLSGLKGLGYILHSAVAVLFARAHNVPLRLTGLAAAVGTAGGDGSPPAGDANALTARIAAAKRGDAVAATARDVTVRIRCAPSGEMDH